MTVRQAVILQRLAYWRDLRQRFPLDPALPKIVEMWTVELRRTFVVIHNTCPVRPVPITPPPPPKLVG